MKINNSYKMVNIISETLIILAVILISSCSAGTSKTSNQTANAIQEPDSNQIDITQLSDSFSIDSASSVTYLFPSPDEILGEILSSKTEFDLNIINPVQHANRYLSSKQQALNLGVYLSDLAYINLNGDKNEALNYFRTIRDLSQKINIYKVFNQNIYDRIQQNITNKDSLNAILKSMYNEILQILEESKRNNIYALVASGALIEALYISTLNVKDFESYKPVATKIFEQKYVINNFYEFVSQYKKDPKVLEVSRLLDNLKKILDKSETTSTQKNIKPQGKDNFTIEGGEDLVITEQNFNQFRQQVIETRKKIITPE